QVQQRALARPRGAYDRHEFPTMRLHIHAPQHLQRLAVTAHVDLANPPGFEQGAHSYRIAATGSRRAAWTDGYSGAKVATVRLAAITASTSTSCVRTGRWSMK